MVKGQLTVVCYRNVCVICRDLPPIFNMYRNWSTIIIIYNYMSVSDIDFEALPLILLLEWKVYVATHSTPTSMTC